MSYLAQAQIAEDQILWRRVAACAASEGERNPYGWAQEMAWEVSAQPGWADAYKYALDSGVEAPGADESVITDGMILAAVQGLRDESDGI